MQAVGAVVGLCSINPGWDRDKGGLGANGASVSLQRGRAVFCVAKSTAEGQLVPRVLGQC